MEDLEKVRETSVLLSAIEDIHAGQDGLVNLGQLIGNIVSAPALAYGKKVYVAVVGNGQGPTHFIEHYTGKPIQNKGLGTEEQFTVIEHGASKQVTKGGDAMKKMKGADRLARVSGLEKKFASEQVESPRLDFEVINFVRMPVIEGFLKGDKASTDDAIDRIREALTDTDKHGSLRQIFQSMDVNKDNGSVVWGVHGVYREVYMGVYMGCTWGVEAAGILEYGPPGYPPVGSPQAPLVPRRLRHQWARCGL